MAVAKNRERRIDLPLLFGICVSCLKERRNGKGSCHPPLVNGLWGCRDDVQCDDSGCSKLKMCHWCEMMMMLLCTLKVVLKYIFESNESTTLTPSLVRPLLFAARSPLSVHNFGTISFIFARVNKMSVTPCIFGCQIKNTQVVSTPGVG
jgi:hypothetical protein